MFPTYSFYTQTTRPRKTCIYKNIRRASGRVRSLKLSFLPTVRCYLPFFHLSYFPTGLRTLLLGRARGRPGDPGTQNRCGCRIPWPFWRPFGDSWANFAIFLTTQSDIKKSMIFDIVQNGPNGTINRPLGTRGSILDQNT